MTYAKGYAVFGPPSTGFETPLRDRGIQTSIHYRPVHDFSFYRRRFPTSDATLPMTIALAPRLLTLPLYLTLTAAQQEKVIAALRAASSER